MSRTFKTNEDSAGGQEIENIVFYSGNWLVIQEHIHIGENTSHMEQRLILRIQSIHMMHKQRMHL